MNKAQLTALEVAMSQDEIDTEAIFAVINEQIENEDLSPMLMAVAHADRYGEIGELEIEVHRLRATFRTVPWMYAESSRQWLKLHDELERESETQHQEDVGEQLRGLR